MTTLRDDRFEERLLTELRTHVEERAASATKPGHRVPAAERTRGARHAAGSASPTSGRRRGQGRLTRAPRVVLAGAGVAIAAAIAIVATGGSGATPAYAIAPHDDGSVTVTIHSLADTAGLQQKLRDVGVRADVKRLDPGYVCADTTNGPTRTPEAALQRARSSLPPKGIAMIATRTTDDGTTFTIGKGLVHSDAHVVISTSGDDHSSSVSVTVSASGGCTPRKAPADPAAALNDQGAPTGPAQTAPEQGQQQSDDH
ncbi:MAG TPA: hypothetical protein VGM91_23665 [Conexibacter sp.]|jgi:hypothetical protein